VNLNTRVFFSVFGMPFLRRLILPLGVFLMAVTMLDPMTDWTALRAQLASRPAWQVALLFTLLMVTWGIAVGRALRPVWRQPVVSFLLRQPVGRWYWVRHLLPALWIAFLPIVMIWWLAPRHAHPIVHYLGFVGLFWTIFLGASFRGSGSLTYIAIGTVAVAALVFGYALHPGTAYLAMIVTILLLPLGIGGIRDQLVQSRKTSPGHLASRWPVIAIVRRDLLCLWRLERKSLVGLVLPGIVAALLMLALRVNGQVTGYSAFIFACVLFSLSVMPAYDVLTRLKTGLGPELIRQRWPVSHGARGIALLGIVLALTGPNIIVLAWLGSTMGPGYSLLFLLFAANTIVGLTALFSRTLVVAAPMLGWSLWLLLIHAILVMTLPASVYAATAAITVPLGISMMRKGLQMFAHQTEFGNLDQFA